MRKSLVIIILGLYSSNILSQDIPLGNKIVGNGDPVNYYIGHYPVPGSDGLDLHWYGGIRFGNRSGNSIMQITDNNVGIGTPAPNYKLDVNVASIDDRFQVQHAGNVRFYASGEGVVKWGRSADSGCLTWDTDLAIVGGQSMKALSLRANGADQVRITTSGNVGIGTTIPDAKLAVNGDIHAKEVRVTLNVPAPDYVFAPDYRLKSLKEVEDYINKNSHLPEIPSAKEFEKNGLMLAEMNMSLLKKVEELTLYAIVQEKRTEALIEFTKEQENRMKIQLDTIEILKKENERFKILSERLSIIEKELENNTILSK